jgi:hypothetical protein
MAAYGVCRHILSVATSSVCERCIFAEGREASSSALDVHQAQYLKLVGTIVRRVLLDGGEAEYGGQAHDVIKENVGISS